MNTEKDEPHSILERSGFSGSIWIQTKSECCPLLSAWEETLPSTTQSLVRTSQFPGHWLEGRDLVSISQGLLHSFTFGTCVRVLPSSWSFTSLLSSSLHLSNTFKIYLNKSLLPFPTEVSSQWLWSLPALVPCLRLNADDWLWVRVHWDCHH